MQKIDLKKFHIISFIFVSILGVILHFLYNWSGENIFVGIFSAINESIWEHLKLIFYPMLLSSIIGYFVLGKDIENYWCSRVIGILSAIIFVVIFFYTYTGVLGKMIDAINILSFFIAVGIGEYVTYRNMLKEKTCNKNLPFYIIVTLIFYFTLFTFAPPQIGIFKDPVDGSCVICNIN